MGRTKRWFLVAKTKCWPLVARTKRWFLVARGLPVPRHRPPSEGQKKGSVLSPQVQRRAPPGAPRALPAGRQAGRPALLLIIAKQGVLTHVAARSSPSKTPINAVYIWFPWRHTRWVPSHAVLVRNQLSPRGAGVFVPRARRPWVRTSAGRRKGRIRAVASTLPSIPARRLCLDEGSMVATSPEQRFVIKNQFPPV